MGGVAFISLLLGMVRTKFAATYIGSVGVGLLANFSALQGLIGAIAGLGVQSSAVRDVASAYAANDQVAIGRTVLTLRRVCWLTGLLGAATMAVLSPWLSQITFGSDQYQWDIAAVGIIIFLSNVTGGQLALLQGARRIADMARIQITGSVVGTIITVAFYFWLGLRGIIPALVMMALVQLLISWHFARAMPVPVVEMKWLESFHYAGDMIKLGLAMMWTGLLGSVVSYFTLTMITHEINLQAVGIYSAAFALSGVLVNFILAAMATDYYPHLTSVANDKVAMNRLVNEQAEIGLLIAIPGLLATLTFAPWIIRILYSHEFLPAVTLLHWFVLGCLGRVISWPLGFVMLALGKGRLFFFTETAAQFFYLALIAIGLLTIGLKGVAVASFALYVVYIVVVYFVARRLTGFSWSASCKKQFLLYLPAIVLVFVSVEYMALWPATFTGLAVTAVTSIISLRGLVSRVGLEHRFVKTMFKIPGMRLFLGVNS